METVDRWITDGHQAMLDAIAAKFPASQRQCCVVYKTSTIESHVPEKYRDALHAELRAIFYQPDRAQADQAAAAFMAKYERQYPSAIRCMQRDWEACLTFHAYPEKHWVNIRTSNLNARSRKSRSAAKK